MSDSKRIRTHNHLVQKRTPVWLNVWVFAYELSGRGFESRFCHLNVRRHACFKQGAPWHSGNHGVYVHSETHTWHDNNIQSKTFYILVLIFKMYGFWLLLFLNKNSRLLQRIQTIWTFIFIAKHEKKIQVINSMSKHNSFTHIECRKEGFLIIFIFFMLLPRAINF